MLTFGHNLGSAPNKIEWLTKRTLRSKIKNRLKKQKEEERQKKSSIIKRKLFRLPEFKNAKRIMFYMSDAKEVDTREMIVETMKKGKIVSVPVCDINRRKIIPCKLTAKDKFQTGPYGIKEPCIKRALTMKDIDLVIVPGIAFDVTGNRLGRGGGYYDSFLGGFNRRVFSVGLAFKFQILPSIPTTNLDIAVDKVLFA